MNKYQKLIAKAIRNASPYDKTLIEQLGYNLPKYRVRRIAWRSILKERNSDNIDDIKNIIFRLNRLNNTITD